MSSFYDNDRRDDDDDSSEAWIFSYADMVTVLLGFFIILFSLSSVDSERFDKVSESIAQALKGEKKAPEKGRSATDAERQLRAFQLLVSMLNIAPTSEAATQKIEKAYSAKADAKAAAETLTESLRDTAYLKDLGLVIDESKDKQKVLEIVLPQDTLFDVGGTELSESAKSKVSQLAGELAKVDDLVQLEVVGHTDSSPPSATSLYKDNFTLSSLRAGAVARELVRSGVSRRLISVRGVGDLEPLFAERDRLGRNLPDNMSRNRRVAIIIKQRPPG